MKLPLLAALIVLGFAGLSLPANAETLLVDDGKANAEIIIAEKPPRMVRLAAKERQTYVEKISGGRLPIKTAPGEAPVRVYVGKSKFTDQLGITDSTLTA